MKTKLIKTEDEARLYYGIKCCAKGTRKLFIAKKAKFLSFDEAIYKVIFLALKKNIIDYSYTSEYFTVQPDEYYDASEASDLNVNIPLVL